MSAAPKLAMIPASPMRLEPGDILTVKQLAQRLHRPVSWVYKHTDNTSRRRKLPVLNCDGCLLFSWPEVVEWLRGKG